MANPLEFLITAKDLASEQFEKVSTAIEKSKSRTAAFKGVATIASAAIVAGVVDFAKNSVEAYSEAEDKQTALENAYKKFPQLAHGNIDALREFNEALQAKTGADHNDLASMESTLAMYGANQKQIEKLAPLVVDFAAKTHVSMDQAAKSVGMGLAGQTRALRQVGIAYKATGDKTKDLAAITRGLSKTVGGYAEGQAKTASGQTHLLGVEFKDVQETVGSLLMPALVALGQVAIKVFTWLNANRPVVVAIAVVIGVLTLALIAANIAMWAMAAAETGVLWPIMLIVAAIAAVIVVIVLLVTHWKQVVSFLRTVWNAVVNWVRSVLEGFGKWWNSFWNGILTWFRNLWNAEVLGWRIIITAVTNWIRGVFNGFRNWWNTLWVAIGSFVVNLWNNGIVAPIRNAINWIVTTIHNAMTGIRFIWSNVWNGLVGIVRGVMNGVIGAVQGGINGAIGIINGLIGAFNSVAGLVHIHIGTIPSVSLPHFAGGTGDAPGGFSVVGENGPEIMQVPRHAMITPNGKSAQVRLHPEDIAAIGRMVYSMIQQGAYVAIGDALGG